ncbi:pimeloyl-ACP methyl ester carboxylesterase [Amycolatopsis sulphurea]|uniref:Pimeloyl-ACP methyl ester carboxylesterase n=1 Tax=Amycolatopsis sulphurea TaxID=76022 RepID=A0A2A9FEJ7_9PSEU|nr:alpha/beta fold hydrolase [Amycolatopsis sulphurea]PFG49196.1 pimeloyl-ACP methyl ester carboxylesterase [Amycolatopsis sulphurea]
MSTTLTDRTVSTWNDRVTIRVRVGGDGPPLVYLHPSGGLAWDPFLDRLAEHYTIYAPEFPGTTPGDPYAIHQIDDLWDTVLIYEQTLRGLGLSAVPVVGQSFGGMLGAELAAAYPDLVSRLVLLDPIGLWRDDAPVANWIAAPPTELPGLLFADPTGDAAQAMFAMPEDPDALASAQAAMVWNLGATGKLCWPIPDRGLGKRLHRITAPTLVVWGEQDALISPAYAEEFRNRIADSRVEIIPKSGHIPQVEQTETTYTAVSAFLG